MKFEKNIKPLCGPAYGSPRRLKHDIRPRITYKFSSYRSENTLPPHYNANDCSQNHRKSIIHYLRKTQSL